MTILPAWNPENVVRDLMSACTSVYPKDQYITGIDAQINMMMLRMLPYRIYYKITNKILGRVGIIPAALRDEKKAGRIEEPKKAQ